MGVIPWRILEDKKFLYQYIILLTSPGGEGVSKPQRPPLDPPLVSISFIER